MTISGRTRVFTLLGDPVAHSLSPAMQNEAFAAANVDGVYIAMRCSAETVPALMMALAHAGGGGNVTIPHKAVAAAALQRRTAVVEATGACNTFWLEDGLLMGDNTDVTGLDRIMAGLVGSASDTRCLVLGAGGAARAAVHALLDKGASVLVLGRNEASLDSLGSTFAPAGKRLVTSHAPEVVREQEFDVVINATPLGMKDDDDLPLDLDAPARVGAIIDMVCRDTGTPFMQAATRRGIRAVDGREMLVAQGADAFERWWNVPAPVRPMREAVGLDR